MNFNRLDLLTNNDGTITRPGVQRLRCSSIFNTHWLATLANLLTSLRLNPLICKKVKLCAIPHVVIEIIT